MPREREYTPRPFNEEAYTASLLTNLDEVYEKTPDPTAEGVAQAVESLPPIPPESLRRDRDLLNRLLHVVYQRLPEEQKTGRSGHIASHIYNHAVGHLPPDYLGTITQELDLRDVKPIHSIAGGFPGGRLKIKGEAGSHLGLFMSGGKIIVDKAGDHLGDSMSKGTIAVGEAGHDVGEQMSGGTIYITTSYKSLGERKYPTGGHIFKEVY